MNYRSITIRKLTAYLKVSKSRKQILKVSFEPKNKQKYFRISALASKHPYEVVETKYKSTKRPI